MYLIDSTVKRLPYFNGFQSFSLSFASINDDNINFISLREVIQAVQIFLLFCISVLGLNIFPSFIIKHHRKICSILSYMFMHISTSTSEYSVMDSFALWLILNCIHLLWCKCISSESYQQIAEVHGRSLSHLTLDACREDTCIYSDFFRIHFQSL